MGIILASLLTLISVTINAERAWAAPISGICEFSKNYRLIQKKTCVLDHWNSGLIQITTNNGTLNFKLHNSMLDQYNLNGEIWYLKGDIFEGGVFVLVKDPSRQISWSALKRAP